MSRDHALLPLQQIQPRSEKLATARRATKIVCTIGKHNANFEALSRMIAAGMNVARFNMSYFPLDALERTVREVERAAKEAGQEVGIIVDLKGPGLRTLQHDCEDQEIFLNEGA